MDLSALLSPASMSVISVLILVGVFLLRMESARRQMFDLVADEVAKRNRPERPKEVDIKQPFIVSSDDPSVRRSACLLHMTQVDNRVSDLSGRVERLERKLDFDIQRLHQRVDEINGRIDAIPDRVVHLMAETKDLHS
jgi:tetrahydromethanopterin S-methyltransferase subunit G